MIFQTSSYDSRYTTLIFYLRKYTYDDKKYGRSMTGAYRGVCRCCTGKECDPQDKQNKTLIPWSTVHGRMMKSECSRVKWNGYFAATTTRICPVFWQVSKIIILNLVIKQL